MLMRNISVIEILAATGGALIAGDRGNMINGVSIDSRQSGPGMMFIAIPGERVDGHDYIEEAIDKGCSAVLISSKRDHAIAKALEKGTAIIRVTDTVIGLQEVAAYYLSLFDIKKIAVTGSTGKTTTKEMLYCILSEKYNTIRNLLNYNNAIGLPLSIFKVKDDTQVAVFEMGMDCPGEIHRLTELVQPQVGVITNVGLAHLERLGTRENILKAKMEIVDFLGSGDVLVLNNDDKLLSKAKPRGEYKVLTVGQEGEVRISGIVDMGERGISFCLDYKGESMNFALNIPGRHNALNAALAVGAALCCGSSMEEAKRGLERFAPPDKRGLLFDNGVIRIIDDSYNANPDSMVAAIDMLMAVNGERKVAVLGDMGELGEGSKEFHSDLGKYIGDQSVNVLITVGNDSQYIRNGAGEKIKGQHYKNKEDFHQDIIKWIMPGDIILVKGSRFMEMDKTVEFLKQAYKE